MSSFLIRFCDIQTTFQDSWLRDGEAWAFHASTEVALKNLSAWVDPFPGRGSSVSNEPFFDTDLYTIHTLRLTSTIHLHFDSMSLKISNAASELLGLINFLNPGDYCYLDPILAVRFYCLLFSISRLLADDIHFWWSRLAGTLLLSAYAVWWISLLLVTEGIQWYPMPMPSSARPPITYWSRWEAWAAMSL